MGLPRTGNLWSQLPGYPSLKPGLCVNLVTPTYYCGVTLDPHSKFFCWWCLCSQTLTWLISQNLSWIQVPTALLYCSNSDSGSIFLSVPGLPNGNRAPTWSQALGSLIQWGQSITKRHIHVPGDQHLSLAWDQSDWLSDSSEMIWANETTMTLAHRHNYAIPWAQHNRLLEPESTKVEMKHSVPSPPLPRLLLTQTPLGIQPAPLGRLAHPAFSSVVCERLLCQRMGCA